MDDPARPAGNGVVELRRVRKAYEQVADQLRALIATGEVQPGERLPNEATLSAQMGVSRATIREALRSLAAQNMIRTVRGAAGGSFVTLPTTDHVVSLLGTNIALLSDLGAVSLDDLLEMRELLEVPAARLAAQRRTGPDLEELDRLTSPDPRHGALDGLGSGFHSAVAEASGNALLPIYAQPVFAVLHAHLEATTPSRRFLRQAHDDHRAIAAAIEAGDADAAGTQMHRHLDSLRPVYRRAWRATARRRAGDGRRL